jgi:hypothetical protein
MLMPRRASRLSAEWFTRPLIPGIAVLLALFAGIGFLGLRVWHERQAVSLSVEHSREVLETLDLERADIAHLEAERRASLTKASDAGVRRSRPS